MTARPLRRTARWAAALTALALTALAPAACGGDDGADGQVTLRLGYFANLTHAQALVGLADGTFQKELGPDVTIKAKAFNAGPMEIEALFAGELDAAFIGPNPTVNGWVKSKGEALHIVSGAASGGALLIVRPAANITKPADLAGKKITSPQLGGTQDVALRSYVLKAGLKTKENGGNVTVLPTSNADTITLFKKGDIDGAWLPEPWASRLVTEAGGKVLLDERTLWPGGRFVTTQLIVSSSFLRKHPAQVEALVRANVLVTQAMNADPAKAKEAVNAEIKRITGAALAPEVVEQAWANIEFTWDPIASSLRTSTDAAFALGFLGDSKPKLDGLYDLAPLNRVLDALKLPPVKE
jgi:NitT/TauT family transport system substrate-binding protein